MAASGAAPHAEARPLALVAGAGAQGLACGLRLWERGWDVLICAGGWLSQTTSSGAGAIWEYPPFEVQPQAEARRWVLESLPCFAAALAAAGSARSGVRIGRSYYCFRSRASADERYGPIAAWSPEVPFFQEGPPPPGLVREATFGYCFSYAAPVVNMRRYLGWLTDSLGALPGVRLQQRRLAGPADLASLASAAGADVVVNCLGLGAGAVFGDSAVHAVRGDLVYILAPGAESQHGLAHVSDEDDPSGLLTYAVPQGDGVVALAGTLRPLGAGELEDGYAVKEDTVPDGEVAASIVARNAAAFPGAVLPAALGEAVGSPVVVGRWSGARPQRHGGVRLEREELRPPGASAAVQVVHNYGHGGSGVVTSWGCAAEACGLAAEALAAGRGAAAACGLRPRPLPAALAPLALGSVRAAGAAALERAVAEGAVERAAARSAAGPAGPRSAL